VEVVSLIWSSGQTLSVQLPVVLAIAAARTREVVHRSPHASTQKRRTTITLLLLVETGFISLVEFHVVKYNISSFGGNYGKPQPNGFDKYYVYDHIMECFRPAMANWRPAA
jgi:hypothetical protein